jgi:homoserine dehydrogenase
VLAAGAIRTSRYYRLVVDDAPGVLARIAEVFGRHEVSIASVWQEGVGGRASLLLITHEALESSHEAAMADLGALDVVADVAAVLRVHPGA